MLTACEKGCVDIVLCKSQSRFSRDMEAIENIFAANSLKNTSAYGIIDSSNQKHHESRSVIL
jgi:DNA invertase Pin-like site-specific DNA recombinase